MLYVRAVDGPLLRFAPGRLAPCHTARRVDGDCGGMSGHGGGAGRRRADRRRASKLVPRRQRVSAVAAAAGSLAVRVLCGGTPAGRGGKRRRLGRGNGRSRARRPRRRIPDPDVAGVRVGVVRCHRRRVRRLPGPRPAASRARPRVDREPTAILGFASRASSSSTRPPCRRRCTSSARSPGWQRSDRSGPRRHWSARCHSSSSASASARCPRASESQPGLRGGCRGSCRRCPLCLAGVSLIVGRAPARHARRTR